LAVPASATDESRKDLASDAFQKIVAQFDPIVAALQPYMEKWTKGKKVWAFWSGNGANAVAKQNSEVSLEKSALGSLFDGINITGSWDIQMWAALSRAYASAAAKNVEQKTYRGFVGPGSSNEESIFHKVEQPTFAGMLDQKQQANIKVSWHAVAVKPDAERVHDPTCNSGGMEGVIGTGPDRGAMVKLAESSHAKRLELFGLNGKMVPLEQLDAELAAAHAAKAAGAPAGNGKAAAAGEKKQDKPSATKDGQPGPSANPSVAAASTAVGQKLPPPGGGQQKGHS
jgi:hypothetical protein